MLRKFNSLPLALSLLLAAPLCGAATITVSNSTASGSNVGLVTSDAPSTTKYSDSTTWTDHYATTTTLSSLLITAPTTTTPGLAYDYATDTTTYDANRRKWHYDEVALSASADKSKYSGGKTLVLQGQVTASIDTTVTFNLFSSGSFLPSSSPFGDATPTLPTLYFGSTLASVGAVSQSTTVIDNSNHEYGVNSGAYTWNLTAGQTVSFAAAVYAPSDVSLGLLYMTLRSGNYDVVETTDVISSSSTRMIGAHAVPVLAVPEPETYAMLLAGLAVLAGARRRAAQKSA